MALYPCSACFSSIQAVFVLQLLRSSHSSRCCCRYLLDVGSLHLPLKSLVDNTIGDRLEVVVNKSSEVRPLLAALRHNVTVQELVVVKMGDEDVLKVRFVTCITDLVARPHNTC